MRVKTVRGAGRCLWRMAALTYCTLQIRTHACDLACDASFQSTLPSSSITNCSVIMMLALSVLSFAAYVQQSSRHMANIWHTSHMPHHQSDVLAQKKLLDSTVVPTGRTMVRAVLTHMGLMLKCPFFFHFYSDTVVPQQHKKFCAQLIYHWITTNVVKPVFQLGSVAWLLLCRSTLHMLVSLGSLGKISQSDACVCVSELTCSRLTHKSLMTVGSLPCSPESPMLLTSLHRRMMAHRWRTLVILYYSTCQAALQLHFCLFYLLLVIRNGNECCRSINSLQFVISVIGRLTFHNSANNLGIIYLFIVKFYFLVLGPTSLFYWAHSTRKW